MPRGAPLPLCCVGNLPLCRFPSHPRPPPTFQAEARPCPEQVSPAATALLTTWTSRRDSSRAWGRPHCGQGTLHGKLRSPQPHPQSPTIPNPLHPEPEVEPDAETSHPTSGPGAARKAPSPPSLPASYICQTSDISESPPTLRPSPFFSFSADSTWRRHSIITAPK